MLYVWVAHHHVTKHVVPVNTYQQHGLGGGLFQPCVHRVGVGVEPMVRRVCFPLDKGFEGALGIFVADDGDGPFQRVPTSVAPPHVPLPPLKATPQHAAAQISHGFGQDNTFPD